MKSIDFALVREKEGLASKKREVLPHLREPPPFEKKIQNTHQPPHPASSRPYSTP